MDANLPKVINTGSEKFERDARAWGLTYRQALVIFLIPILTVLAGIALVPLFNLFVWITSEDSLIEWLQFFLLLFSSLVFAAAAIRSLRNGERAGWLFLLVALGAFFVAGEEIAWGQRVIGWTTPAELAEINYQQETTLHNLSFTHTLFINAVMLIGLYGALAPLIWLAWRGEERPTLLSRLFVPPASLIPAFFMPFAYRLTRLVLPMETWFPHLVFPITKISEITEVCLYFGLAVFAWLCLRYSKPKTRSTA